jgi:hypothetical protein
MGIDSDLTHKWCKGDFNFDIKTITEIEKELNIKLI